MAARYRLTLEHLRRVHPLACETDLRLMHRDGESLRYAIARPADAISDWVYLDFCGPREMRVLAAQLEWYAARAEEPSDTEEEVP